MKAQDWDEGFVCGVMTACPFSVKRAVEGQRVRLTAAGNLPFSSNHVSQCHALTNVAREIDMSVFIVSFLQHLPGNVLPIYLLLHFIFNTRVCLQVKTYI